jgi:hypothetical protein
MFSLEARPTSWHPIIVGIVFVAAFVLLLVYGSKGAKRASCPVCGNFLTRKTLSTGKCFRCGTRILFDDSNVAPEKR